jgi:hypothetical protein
LVNPLEFLKVGGFSPQISVGAKEGLVWQTHDMMFIGSLAWNWAGRLVGSLSNEAFNELNGRKVIDVNGAPLDVQAMQSKVKDGLFKLAEPYLQASAKHFENSITTHQADARQNLLINKSMELKEKELEAMVRLLGTLPKNTLDMLTQNPDYQSRLGQVPTQETLQKQHPETRTGTDRGRQDEEKHPDLFKPKQKTWGFNYNYYKVSYNGKRSLVRLTASPKTQEGHLEYIARLSDTVREQLKERAKWPKGSTRYKAYSNFASSTSAKLGAYYKRMKQTKP